MKTVVFTLLFSLTTIFSLSAQQLKLSIGPEVLHSFHHDETFYGWGGSIQTTWWVRYTLGLGLNTGYYRFTSTTALIGANKFPNYALIPVFFNIRYPIPLFKGLYGQDMFGYAFAQEVYRVTSNEKVNGGFTYYFTLGCVIKDHFDISAKVGRTRLDKKDDAANVNEHNFGLKLAYIF